MNNRKIYSDNFEHFLDCITDLQNDLKKFRDVPNFKLTDGNNRTCNIRDTRELYEYAIMELESIIDIMEIQIKESEL